MSVRVNHYSEYISYGNNINVSYAKRLYFIQLAQTPRVSTEGPIHIGGSPSQVAGQGIPWPEWLCMPPPPLLFPACPHPPPPPAPPPPKRLGPTVQITA
jgi:hypothetical protein